MMTLLNTKQVSEMLGYTEGYVQKLIKLNQWDRLPPCYLIGKRYMFKESEVETWVDSKRCS